MAQSLVNFIVLGLLGGVAYVFMWAKSFDELKQYSSARRIVLGAIVGFLYSFLYSEWSFPNMVMTFVAGYMGTDFIEAIVERFKPKPPPTPTP